MKMSIDITRDVFEDMLDDRFNYAQETWGDNKTKAMWEYVEPVIMDTLDAILLEHRSPKYIVDNYIVNSEIVSREEFEDPNYCIPTRDQYSCFEDYAENEGIIYDEDFVVINLGF